ncbi:hypothetical protein TNCV_4398111 [Trichonephila clavipes]|nr:hypothetical protein TNCV_4398111 [Trichonephila clavipes]
MDIRVRNNVVIRRLDLRCNSFYFEYLIYSPVLFPFRFNNFMRLRYPSGQDIGSWLANHEPDPSTTTDPPGRGVMDVKSVAITRSVPNALV